MKNFASALKNADALTAKEMKNVKGGGNCGFMYSHASELAGHVICELDESQYDAYIRDDEYGDWCCDSCGEIGC